MAVAGLRQVENTSRHTSPTPSDGVGNGCYLLWDRRPGWERHCGARATARPFATRTNRRDAREWLPLLEEAGLVLEGVQIATVSENDAADAAGLAPRVLWARFVGGA
jgi:hypothetical protein